MNTLVSWLHANFHNQKKKKNESELFIVKPVLIKGEKIKCYCEPIFGPIKLLNQ